MRLIEVARIIGARHFPLEEADLQIGRLSCHPGEVKADDCFGLFPEFFIYNQWWDEAAMEAVVREIQPKVILARRPIEGYRGILLQVDQPRVAFARLANEFYGRPDEATALIGITGTNGKTTTAHLAAHLVQKLTGSGGLIGTLGTFRNGEPWAPGEFTTNLALPTVQTLSRMVQAGTRAVAMEVSSHGLALDRVAGLKFRAGVVTNIARDHLDFHGSQDAYVTAKAKLFSALEPTALAVINADDLYCPLLLGVTEARAQTYGWSEFADWRVVQSTVTPSGSRAMIQIREQLFPLETRLVGRFQIANILAAAVAVADLGFDPGDVLQAVADFHPVPGRMETIPLRSGATAVIDYAHNPDGLSNLLENCRAMHPKRLLLVFGCGGDRDRGKRPLMGEIAAQGAECIWVTSDNPRTEDPDQIIQDILRGIPPRDGVIVQVDRAAAIEAAWREAASGDLLVIAGKGHEDYQLIGTTKYPFSDRSAVEGLERRAVDEALSG